MARDIRQRALEKLAALSAKSAAGPFDKSDLDKLCKACPNPAKTRENGHGPKQPSGMLGRVPMNIREYEVLLALCKAAPLVQTSQGAQKLARQLIPYILDSHAQVFAPSPFFRKIEPSPTESLTFHVTAALLSLGINHDGVHESALETMRTFVSACSRASEAIPPAGDDGGNIDDAIRTATIAVSLLGFLDAAAAQAEFWRSGGRLRMVEDLRRLLSGPFLIAVETAFSSIRNSHSQDRVAREWKRYMRHYSEARRPLGAMLLQRSYARLLAASTSLLVAEVSALKNAHVLDLLMSGKGLLRPATARSADGDFRSVETYANRATDQLNYLEASADFIRLGSAAQQHVACGVRAAALVCYLNCARLNEDAADADQLMAWLGDTLADPVDMAHEELASTVLRAMALACRISPDLAANVSRLLPRFIVQSGARSQTIETASKCLAFVLQLLSPDAVITTLYTLGNVLSPGGDRGLPNGLNGADLDGVPPLYQSQGRHSTGSSISLQLGGEEEASVVYGNVVQAICGIASACRDEKITALAQSVMLQKMDKISPAVDAQIVAGAAALALSGGAMEFRSLLKLYTRACHGAVVEHRDGLLNAVMRARNHISANLRRDSPLFDIYWEHLLDGIISKGDVQHSGQTKESDVQLAAREIAHLLHPLAVFMTTNDFALSPHGDDERHAMLRDAWFNIAVHGFSPATERGKRHLDELRVMAVHSPPLVAEQRGEQVESDIELNTVLRRGMSSEREAVQKKHLCELLPSKATEIRGLSYRKVIFLQAAYLVESLRADAGNCATALSYFLEPSMRRGDVSSIMEGVASAVVERYLRKTLGGASPTFAAQYAASQLVAILCACCHRIERVQQAAYGCADRIIREVPSALCHRSSLFALLELLSLMWSSCLEAETDLYEPRTTFRSARSGVTVELSDDYAFRRATLDTLYKKAKAWVSATVSLAPTDVKGLLQTYLSDYDDDGAYGHISLGRSFALELGSSIPRTDQRLQSLERLGDAHINTASDFVAQYTTRQEYRYAETLPDRSLEWLSFMRADRRSSFLPGGGGGSGADSADAVTALAHIEARLLRRKTTPLADVRDILRRAAALLCRSEREECAVAHYLVSIPFAMFTKQSIKLGVSLWLGVMNENPRAEPRLLNEIAAQWEISIQKRLGLFSTAMAYPDPFVLAQEFAPSDSAGMAKMRQAFHNLLSPHTRLLQFFSSHFNATRLGSPDTEKVFLRLLDLTLDAVATSTPHPMARDIKFQIVLFGLHVLRVSTTLGAIAQWRLKDKVLSAALSWFNGPPRWSFGSNVLQMKTEIRLLSDVLSAMSAVSYIGANPVGEIRSLHDKEHLLMLLIESEQMRLKVWVYPLGEPTASSSSPATPALHSGKGALENALAPLVRTAWAEHPSLAIGLTMRFPNPKIHSQVRWLLLNFPAKAVSDPDALPVLLDGALRDGQLPADVSFQLKYLLYWAPVCPITAVTYFLPAFQDHPLIIQYAMRALESHSVDVTFFYVPQIVQTLRYDVLGYVERYILETAQFSQLFAHQIIWNMKANAYKDDDSTIPDAIKPTLDKVMAKMVESFSPADRGFYEREFAFFDEVTGISGKLKPLIKRPREEKKQKIEEELRRIKVEVGVYLPSNPDGVVIGIDRKSGKPLQSHAKAPFLATFRIRKNRPTEFALPEGAGINNSGSSSANGNGNGSLAPLPATTSTLAPTESTKAGGGEAHANGTRAPGAAAAAGASSSSTTVEVWQSAIFKVGDDCRQDLLALQMIAAFRGIFHSVGLDVYVFPYRVTATAPGCGVIDVLPNSISRDMLGREAVNGLYEYFVSKFGNEDSLRFQQARNNFVKSMAAYSIISFLLQFKDRHNGNIMIDDAGHILHVDFGFCFDIAPGGIKFERAPFKLTSEMMAVMGGSTDSQAFKWFEELCVKAFLASRQHTDKLAQIALLMMGSGLPCFKPESVTNFKQRFVVDRSEREAADFVKGLIRKSHSSYSTGVYDSFQHMTNGIPY